MNKDYQSIQGRNIQQLSFDSRANKEVESDNSSLKQDIRINKVKIQPRNSVKIVDTRRNKKVSVSINLQKKKHRYNESPL